MANKARLWSVSRPCPEITVLEAKSSSRTSEYWLLLTADHHWDNPKCHLPLLRKHLKEACDRDAGILMLGDIFCAMQGKYDKRSCKSSLRPEHQAGDYLDTLVKTGADFYCPYAQHIVQISPGNHETAIYGRHETDLTTRLVERLNTLNGTAIQRGGYAGWIRIRLARNTRWSRSILLYYHHGYGGAAPVTKGVIQTNRMATYLPDAQVVVSGHTHGEWIFPIDRVRVSLGNKLSQEQQIHVKLPTYKDEYGAINSLGSKGHEGWHVERGGPPKPLGSAWLRLKVNRVGTQDALTYEVLPLKG